MISVSFMGILYFDFVVNLIGYKVNKFFIRFNYFLSLLGAMGVYTKYFAYEYISYPVIKHWLKAGPLLTIEVIYFFILVGLSFYLLLKDLKKFERLKRVQYLYIFLGTALGLSFGFTNYLLWYGIKNWAILNVFTSICFTILPYAIFRYKLLDVNYAVKKIIAYLIYAGITTTILMLFVNYVFKIKFFNVFVFVALTVSVLPWVFRFISNVVELFILKDFKERLQNLSDFFIDKNYSDIFINFRSWSKSFVDKIHSITNVNITVFLHSIEKILNM